MGNVDKKIAAGLKLFSSKDDNGRNQFIAKVSAHAELSGEETSSDRLHTDVGARERLLYFGRQDVGHALLNTITLLKKVEALQRSVRSLQWLVSAMLLGLLILFFL